MSTINSETLVVQWSPKHQHFHVSRLGQMLKQNMRSFIDGDLIDYIPLALTDGDEQVSEIIAVLERRIRKSPNGVPSLTNQPALACISRAAKHGANRHNPPSIEK
jgi:hypothetical protein